MDFNDPGAPVFQHPLLLEARRLFEAFYSIATPIDATSFDRLVMTREAFTRAAGFPRLIIGSPEGDELERACNLAEQKFMQARDEVRGCTSFKKLHAADQKRIVEILCEPFPPWARE